jgi:hypothetical protein
MIMLEPYVSLVEKIGSFDDLAEVLSVNIYQLRKHANGDIAPPQDLQDRIMILVKKYRIPFDHRRLSENIRPQVKSPYLELIEIYGGLGKLAYELGYEEDYVRRVAFGGGSFDRNTAMMVERLCKKHNTPCAPVPPPRTRKEILEGSYEMPLAEIQEEFIKDEIGKRAGISASAALKYKRENGWNHNNMIDFEYHSVRIAWFEVRGKDDDYDLTFYTIPIDHEMAQDFNAYQGKFINMNAEEGSRVHKLQEFLKTDEGISMKGHPPVTEIHWSVICGIYLSPIFKLEEHFKDLR